MNLIDTNNESIVKGLSGNSIDLGKTVGATIYVNGGPIQFNGGIAFNGMAPTAQQTNAGLTTASAAGTGVTMLGDTTFTGGLGGKAYTLDDLVAALKKLGLIGL